MTIACRYVNGAAARTVIAAAPYRRSAEPVLNARLQRSGSGVRRGDGWRVRRAEGRGSSDWSSGWPRFRDPARQAPMEAPTPDEDRVGDPRRREVTRNVRGVRRSVWFTIASIVLVAFLAGAVFAWRRFSGSTTSGCTLAVDGAHYHLDREQVANAQTIAAQATALGLPHHAVTVALAAALQESRLHNLRSGDRDSVGLFQQRPSQGWGAAAQLVDARYAASAFLRALVSVNGWQNLSVNDAAQRVQHSATPTAYGHWESEARALARFETGEVGGSLSCSP